MVWTVDNPGIGDVAAVQAIAADRGAALADVESALGTLGTVVADLPSSWAGAAADEHLTSIGALLPDLQQLKQSYTNHRDALTTYAVALESIKTAADPLVAQIERLEGELAALNTRRYNSEVPHPTPAPPSGDTAPDLFGLTPLPARWDEADREAAARLDSSIGETQTELHRANLALGQLVSERARADAACVSALDASTVPNTVSKAVWDAVDGVAPEDLAAYLLTLPLSTRTALMLNDPGIVQRLAEAGPDNAGDVAALWVSLGAAAGLLLALKFPRVVGNLEGVLYEYRDVANTRVLDHDLADVRSRLGDLDEGSAEYERLDTQREALEQLDLSLGVRRDEDPPRFLISLIYPDGLDSDKQPLAAVALGNLDTADNATYMVPGMDTNLKDSAVNWQLQAADYYEQQGQILAESGSAESHAVVAWIGYETPGKVSVLSADLARTGAVQLGTALDGYNAVRDATGSDAHLGVIAHSYGSTTAMLTLQDDHGVDSFAVYGSAGQVDNTTVDIPKEDFYYTMGPYDDLAPIGRTFGGRWDPALYNYGDITLIESDWVQFTDENGDVVDLDPARGFLGHTGYLEPGTSSLYNLAAAGLGADDMLVDNSTVRG